MRQDDHQQPLESSVSGYPERFSFPISTLANHCSEGILHPSNQDPGLIEEIAIDTRSLHAAEKSLFVALRGEARDGHAFVRKAYALGVRNFLVERDPKLPKDAAWLQVPDSLYAIQEIASWYRGLFEILIVGITGSNGKTIVKEWLATVVGNLFPTLAKSPGSYNSQIGVPLSLFQLRGDARLGIFEAGISKVGEMERLEQILKPKVGILTHFGDAHAEGFVNARQKLEEKLHLFSNTRINFLSADDPDVLEVVKAKGLPIRTVGYAEDADLQLLRAVPDETSGLIRLDFKSHISAPFISRVGSFPASFSLTWHLPGEANLENVLLVILVALMFSLRPDEIQEGLNKLRPVSMRMELITSNPEITILNDAYNADVASIHNAFSRLEAAQSQPGKILVLTDIEHQGDRQEEVQATILAEAIARFGAANLLLIGPVFSRLCKDKDSPAAYPDTDALLRDFDFSHFKSKVVLLKGARRFALEKLIPYLIQGDGATWFRINMNALRHNFLVFRRLVPAHTKIMAMVKAFSYGSGTWEIASALESEGVDYLAVAYPSEGIHLRNRGVRVPIMVMNSDEGSIAQLFRYDLEPEVFSLRLLEKVRLAGLEAGRKSIRVHVKVDTGMHRLGFSVENPEPLKHYLATHPEIEVVSVMSHLAMAENADEDAYSEAQASAFMSFYTALTEEHDQEVDAGTDLVGQDGYETRLKSNADQTTSQPQPEAKKRPFRHLLNTAGIIRFPQYSFDMVRLGIGLYGISPVPDAMPALREVGSLVSHISQLRTYPPGIRVSYGGVFETARDSLIATVPIGYADGIRRSLSNGVGHFLVREQRVPVVGVVCMDMLMLDVTDVEGVQEGDEVVLFGEQGKAKISVREIAESCDTIPYEILAGISQRVKRVYVRD